MPERRASSTCSPPSVAGEERGGRPVPAARPLGRRRRGRATAGSGSTSCSRAIGPGTERLCALEPGERVWVNGPLGNAFSAPRELAPGAAGAILVGGGIGVAPLALLRRRFSAAGVPAQILLGFRDRAHCGGLDDLFSNCQIGLASDDGHLGERGYVTDLLAAMLEGDDAASAAVYACGPPAMLEAVRGAVRGARRRLRARDGVADGLRLRRLLRLRRPARRAAATCASASTARCVAARADRVLAAGRRGAIEP